MQIISNIQKEKPDNKIVCKEIDLTDIIEKSVFNFWAQWMLIQTRRKSSIVAINEQHDQQRIRKIARRIFFDLYENEDSGSGYYLRQVILPTVFKFDSNDVISRELAI